MSANYRAATLFLFGVIASLSLSAVGQNGPAGTVDAPNGACLKHLVNPQIGAVVACASSVIGPAPVKYETPFYVVRVSVLVGNTCAMDLATNGMLYSVTGIVDDAGCGHLPHLYSLVWGRPRHSDFRQFLRESNTAYTASDFVDLVYENGKKVKAQAYAIQEAQEIGPNWGQ